MLRFEPDQYYNANSRGLLGNFCDNALASAGLLIFRLVFVTWIEAMTKFEAAADWIRYLKKKLLLATVCVIALMIRPH